LEAGLGIGAHRAAIFRVGIGYDPRNSRCEQRVCELPDEARAMAISDQFGLAYELIDATRARRLYAKTLVPGAQRITLQVGERALAEADNELIMSG
jgi:hypothetical protein